MTKEDLQCGYLVLTNDGGYALVMNIRIKNNETKMILHYDDNTYLNLSEFDDDLRHLRDHTYDIVSVYDFPENYNIKLHSIINRKLLFDNRKKMTIKEIEKELGYPIKIVEE